MYIKESVWTSEVNFKSECLAGSQDIKGYFFSLEKHYLLSQFQLHLTGTILINKLIIQFTKTLNFSQLLFGTEICELRGRSQLGPTAGHAVSLLTEVHEATLGLRTMQRGGLLGDWVCLRAAVPLQSH